MNTLTPKDIKSILKALDMLSEASNIEAVFIRLDTKTLERVVDLLSFEALDRDYRNIEK